MPPPTPARELSSINFESMLGGPLIAVVNAQAKAAMSSVNFIKAVGFKTGPDTPPEDAATGEPIYVKFKYPKETKPFEPAIPGEILGIQVTGGGAGYTAAPAVTVAAPPAGGTPAKATAVVAGGVVTSITLDDPGSGYTTAPAVTIAAPPAGPGTAIATANFQPPKAASPAEFATMFLEVPILTMLPIPFLRIEETTIDFNAKINSVEEAKTDTSLKVDSTLNAKVKYPPLFAIASVNLKVSTAFQKNTSSGYKVDRTYSMAVHIRAVQDEMPAGMEKILGILEDAIRSQPETK